MFLFYVIFIKKLSNQNMNIRDTKYRHFPKDETPLGEPSQTLPLTNSS